MPRRARGPVDAGEYHVYTRSASRDWPWSSYAGTAGYAKPFLFVDDTPIRESFGTDEEALELLRAFVEEAVEAVTKL
jgi:hypothetical protein